VSWQRQFAYQRLPVVLPIQIQLHIVRNKAGKDGRMHRYGTLLWSIRINWILEPHGMHDSPIKAGKAG
jgi:hypothetical protein